MADVLFREVLESQLDSSGVDNNKYFPISKWPITNRKVRHGGGIRDINIVEVCDIVTDVVTDTFVYFRMSLSTKTSIARSVFHRVNCSWSQLCRCVLFFGGSPICVLLVFDEQQLGAWWWTWVYIFIERCLFIVVYVRGCRNPGSTWKTYIIIFAVLRDVIIRDHAWSRMMILYEKMHDHIWSGRGRPYCGDQNELIMCFRNRVLQHNGFLRKRITKYILRFLCDMAWG